MSTVIKPTFQIQRINKLENQLKSIQEKSYNDLIRRPSSKSWSPVEVAKHIVLAHEVYSQKINSKLRIPIKLGEATSEFKAAAIPSFLIKRFPPVNGKVKFKMKTSKVFKPVLDVENISEASVREILGQLSDVLEELKSWVNVYRSNPISLKKFNSAIGPIVRFTVPEACEFILCHNERHFLQLNKALSN